MRATTTNTWEARLEMSASAEDVLAVLTDPEQCGEWSPIDFEVEELNHRRLVPGSTARVTGSLAGARVSFDVEVFDGGRDRLRLRASGPLVLDVDYRLAPVDERSTDVTASVTVARGRGFTGRILEPATKALLSAGALQSAVARIARVVEAPAPAA
jgi:polyketide cyclase/dehydrase/lipid transport protein